MIEQFFAECGYVRTEGSVVPLLALRRAFVAWLNDDVQQNRYGQPRAFEALLRKSGIMVGRTWRHIAIGRNDTGSIEMVAANLSGESAFQFGNCRPITHDPELGLLLPRDLTPDEQRSMKL